MNRIHRLAFLLLIAGGLMAAARDLPKPDRQYQGAGEIWWTTVPQIEEAYQKLHPDNAPLSRR